MNGVVRERPILFNGAMVRAILSGAKTQTRRVMKPQPEPTSSDYPMPGHRWPSKAHQTMLHVESEMQKLTGLAGHTCPFGQPGDRLWVRETWTNAWDDGKNQWSDPERYHYRADGIEAAHVDGMERSPWIPSIHMPRRACRLVLEITDVRVERLQAISDADAEAEGIDFLRHVPDADETLTPQQLFHCLWDGTGGNWNANPWVWVIEFKRAEA